MTGLSLSLDLSDLEDSLWQGGNFEFDIEFPPSYPNIPPEIKCLTPIYHPDIE